MKKIELDKLEITLASEPEQKFAVLLTQEDCADCTANENRLKNAFSSVSEIIWYKVYLTDKTPFFAPSVVPAVVFFEGRNRLFEAFGLLEDSSMDAFVQFVRSSLNLTDGEKWLSSTVE
tara:strand:+ start:2473 stop:2829 length:357 start_codon:yes stop_codon:yes gene_type:complete